MTTPIVFFLSLGSMLAASKTLSVDDIVAMHRLQAVQISLDGSRVAYLVEDPNDEAHSKDPTPSSLWVAPAQGGAARQLTRGLVSGPQWSRHGKQIAFLLAGQIHLVSPDGGSPRPLSQHEGGIVSFHWAPEGGRIAYVAPRAERNSPEVQRRLDLGYDAVELDPAETMARRKPNGVWIVDVRTKRAQELPVGGLHVLSVRWSPNGSQLLLVTAARPVTDEEQLRPKLMVASTAGGEPVLYCPTLGKISGADWSPDGRSIAFMGSVAAESDFYPGGLFVCRGPSSTPRNLNPDSPYSLENFRWSGAGESMLVTVARGAHRYLARLSPAEPLPVRITDPAWEVQYRSDYSASSDGKRTALVLAKYNVPPDVWLLDGDGGKRQITHLNPELEQRVYGEGSEVRWKARDGLEISGVRILPVGYKKGVRYPMVVHLHGSNVGEINDFQASSMHWGQMLAAKGFAVLIPNYRGSLTDGPKFMRASKHDWGGKDMLDVLDGVDAMVREGLADPDRLGISGISYGGYLTARTITQTTRFRAAALVSGISNWVGIHTGQTAAPESAHKIEWVENPFDIANLLWDRSPTAHVRNVKSATLIMWGEFDYAIPLSQAIELFRGLRHFGVPSKLVVYPRDGHVPRETNHMRDMLGRAVSWFQQYLLN